MSTELVVIPAEVAEIAEQVSEEKRTEVEQFLNQIFKGTADWDKQIEAIEVKGLNDIMSIQMADVARKNVKNARLSAEKVFDGKRSEVQSRMMDDKLEDSLWLKAKQVMQLKFKAIEEKAQWKADFVKRHEAEQKALRTQLRVEKIAKFAPDMNPFEFENLSDEMFATLLRGLETEHNNRIEAERKAEEERIAREKAEAEERERIRLENEQLRKQAEERERIAKIEAEKRAKEEAVRKAKEDAERKEREQKERKEREAYEAKIRAEQEAKQQLERKIKEREEAEAKGRAEEAARVEAKLNEGDDEKKNDLIEDLKSIKTNYTFKSAKNKKMYKDVGTLIDRVIEHINK